MLLMGGERAEDCHATVLSMATLPCHRQTLGRVLTGLLSWVAVEGNEGTVSSLTTGHPCLSHTLLSLSLSVVVEPGSMVPT